MRLSQSALSDSGDVWQASRSSLPLLLNKSLIRSTATGRERSVGCHLLRFHHVGELRTLAARSRQFAVFPLRFSLRVMWSWRCARDEGRCELVPWEQQCRAPWAPSPKLQRLGERVGSNRTTVPLEVSPCTLWSWGIGASSTPDSSSSSQPTMLRWT